MRRFVAVALVLICLAGTAFAGDCEKAGYLAQELIDSGMVMSVENGFREWYVNPAMWVMETAQVKRSTIEVMSAIRHTCDEMTYIKVFDGYSGKRVGGYGFSGAYLE